MMNNKKIVLACLFVFIQSMALAQIDTKISNLFDELLQDTQSKYASASICVLNAKTGAVVFAKNENVALAPASTLKVITAATAFSILGENFNYQTSLAYTGRVIDGVLQGDLLIMGSGDPTLGANRYPSNNENTVLSTWIKAIKDAGIEKINGAIIGDDHLWGTQSIPLGWIWEDIGNYYGSGIYGLNWKENQLHINLKPTHIGEVVEYSLDKSFAKNNLKVHNEITTGENGTKDQAFAYSAPYSHVIYLRGTWATDISKSRIGVANPDPALSCANQLTDTLNSIGIKVAKPATTRRLMSLNNQVRIDNTRTIAITTSPNLSDISFWFLKKSINLYGEALLKSIALKAEKEPSIENGIAVMIDEWKNKGLDPDAFNIFDGSGLSPANRIPTATMARILFLAQSQPWFKSYIKGFPEHNDMKLKGGHIKNVAAFAGYHTSKSGEKYIVVVNINNFNGDSMNKKLFKVLDVLK